jgi:hypothetical protein
MAAMDVAKTTIKDPLKDKPSLLKEVLEYWQEMGKPNRAKAVWGSPILESKQVLCHKGKREETSNKAENHV